MTWYQALYESPWQQPGLCMLLGLAALAWIAARLPRWRATPFFAAWLALCGVEILVDAPLTSFISPLPPAAVSALAIAFVLLGDARYYVLVERFSRDPAPGSAAWRGPLLRGLGWGALVSLAIAPLARAAPALQANSRMIFLTYECMALAQALAWRFAVIPRRMAAFASPEAAAVGRWLRAVTDFVIVQYALWALADALILWVHPVGFLLRVVPNVLYYGIFVGYVFARAPTGVRP